VKTKILAFLMAAVLGFGTVAAADEVQSLRGKPAVEADTPPPVSNTVEGPRYARNYRQQPPLIPHRIEKYEIDLKVNMCLRCHDWPNNVQENAPMVSVSHFIDREGHKLDKVSSQRWFCVQCHVPQADAKPLVDNSFTPASK